MYMYNLQWTNSHWTSATAPTGTVQCTIISTAVPAVLVTHAHSFWQDDNLFLLLAYMYKYSSLICARSILHADAYFIHHFIRRHCCSTCMCSDGNTCYRMSLYSFFFRVSFYEVKRKKIIGFALHGILFCFHAFEHRWTWLKYYTRLIQEMSTEQIFVKNGSSIFSWNQ